MPTSGDDFIFGKLSLGLVQNLNSRKPKRPRNLGTPEDPSKIIAFFYFPESNFRLVNTIIKMMFKFNTSVRINLCNIF